MGGVGTVLSARAAVGKRPLPNSSAAEPQVQGHQICGLESVPLRHPCARCQSSALSPLSVSCHLHECVSLSQGSLPLWPDQNSLEPQTLGQGQLVRKRSDGVEEVLAYILKSLSALYWALGPQPRP